MKTCSNSKFKKHSQIFNLKTILNNVNNESNLLISKISELQKIFKATKKIINEQINELSKKKKDKIDNVQIKQQIFIKIEKIIKRYNEGKAITSINNKKQEYKKILLEKLNNLNIILRKLKYKNLHKEKDLLIQTIKEKKNICESFKAQIEYEKDLGSIFQPKNLIFFDDLFDINNEVNFQQSKKKKFNHLLNDTKLNLKEKAIASVNDLKEEKNAYIEKFNDFIFEKGFNFTFENKKNREKYCNRIELISEVNYSSDSDSDIDEEESNNNIIFINNNINKTTSDRSTNLKNITKNNPNKKISGSSSEKETNDQEIKNNDNLNLVNKLVEIKEKYNKLINERYDLDYQKNIIQKKIKNIKYKIGLNAFSSSSLSVKTSRDSNNTKFQQKYF